MSEKALETLNRERSKAGEQLFARIRVMQLLAAYASLIQRLLRKENWMSLCMTLCRHQNHFRKHRRRSWNICAIWGSK